jgi:hypothetical protein
MATACIRHFLSCWALNREKPLLEGELRPQALCGMLSPPKGAPGRVIVGGVRGPDWAVSCLSRIMQGKGCLLGDAQ